MSARNSRKNKSARREQRNATAEARKRLHTNAQYRIKEAPDGTTYKDFGICGTCYIQVNTNTEVPHQCTYEFFNEDDMSLLQDTVTIIQEKQKIRSSIWTPPAPAPGELI